MMFPLLRRLIFGILTYHCIFSVDVSSTSDFQHLCIIENVDRLSVELVRPGNLPGNLATVGLPIECGERVELSHIGDAAPKILYQNANDDSYYTLIMADPDAPRRNNSLNSYWLHWLVSSIKGKSLHAGSGGLIGETVLDYQRPSPPEGTGPHRYQFFLYEQQTEQQNAFNFPPRRSHFDLQRYNDQNKIGILSAVFEFVTENTAQ